VTAAYSPLRLAFDCTWALSPRTGVGTFAAAVLDRVSTRADLEVRGFALSGAQTPDVAEAVGHLVPVAGRSRLLSSRWARAAWRRWNAPPIEWVTGAVDVVHSPNVIGPPTRGAAEVVTVHDLSFVHHPQWCTLDTVTWYPPLLARAVQRGAWVHTVSEYVRNEVIATYGADAARVVAIPNATDPLPDADPAGGRRLAGAERYVVAVGTLEPRKNLERLVGAFDLVADQDDELRLVIAGGDGWGAASVHAAIGAARHRDRIVTVGWVDDDTRAALVRGASLLAYPSLYEGFGIPPLEAMQAGTPVVVSREGALPETCGEAAEYVDAHDVDDIAGGMWRVLGNEVRSQSLVDAGRLRVASYSWDATADRLVDLYRAAATERGPR
jgi:glycosyltransferase involved in cell wall biosynthesis